VTVESQYEQEPVGAVNGAPVPPAAEDRELLAFIKEIVDPGVARLLLDWQKWAVANLNAYAREAIQLCVKHRPRSSGVISVVLCAWVGQQEAVVQALEQRCEDLSRVGRRRGTRPPDAAQPGDVRGRYGETQVYLDGRWFVLGPERAP
jgi:hypothetical protein